MNMPKFETKNDLFGYFEATILKRYFGTLAFFKLQNFVRKHKYVSFGPKMPYLGIFGQQFSETIDIFEISTLIFVKLQNLMSK